MEVGEGEREAFVGVRGRAMKMGVADICDQPAGAGAVHPHVGTGEPHPPILRHGRLAGN